MTREEIQKMKKSIENSKQALDDGLILDPEAVAQLYRMIYYYKEKIEKLETKVEKENNL